MSSAPPTIRPDAPGVLPYDPCGCGHAANAHAFDTGACCRCICREFHHRDRAGRTA